MGDRSKDDEIDKLVDVYVKQGYRSDAVVAARARGTTGLTKAEKDKLIEVCIGKGDLEEAFNTAGMGGVSPAAIDMLVEAYIIKNSVYAIYTAKLGASQAEIDRLVIMYLKDGLLSCAMDVAEMRKEPGLTTAEIKVFREKKERQ